MPLVTHPVRSLWGSQPRCARCVCEWLHRKWDGAVSAIAAINFTLHYKPGRTNVDADALSRLTCSEKIENEEVQAILKGCLEQPKFLWEAYACSARVTEDLKSNLPPSKMGVPEWKKAKGLDPAISAVIKMMSNHTLSQRRPSSKDDPELKTYLHQRPKLKLRNGILYRHIDNRDQTEIVCSFVYPSLIDKKPWKDVMIMLDTLAWTGHWTSSEIDSTGLI